MTKRSWVQAPTMETIFQAPFIWIKAWNKNCGKTLTWHCCICCNPANGRVDFEEWSTYEIQLHGTQWIENKVYMKKSALFHIHFLFCWTLVSVGWQAYIESYLKLGQSLAVTFPTVAYLFYLNSFCFATFKHSNAKYCIFCIQTKYFAEWLFTAFTRKT